VYLGSLLTEMLFMLVQDDDGRTSVWYTSHKGAVGLWCVSNPKRHIWHSWFLCYCELPSWKTQVLSGSCSISIFKWYSVNKSCDLLAAMHNCFHCCNLLHTMLCHVLPCHGMNILHKTVTSLKLYVTEVEYIIYVNSC